MDFRFLKMNALLHDYNSIHFDDGKLTPEISSQIFINSSCLLVFVAPLCGVLAPCGLKYTPVLSPTTLLLPAAYSAIAFAGVETTPGAPPPPIFVLIQPGSMEQLCTSGQRRATAFASMMSCNLLSL